MRQKGFTLIELLIVVAIIGIIAAIAIPNLLDAIERSRQKRTVSDVRSMAGACQTFSTDYGGYPRNALSGDPAGTWPTEVDTQASGAIVPDLIQAVPSMDGWSRPYNFMSGPDATASNPTLGQVTAGHYAIWSFGADGAPGSTGVPTPGSLAGTAIAASWCVNPPVATGTLQIHCYQDDIVFGDSSFLQAPEGKQKKC